MAPPNPNAKQHMKAHWAKCRALAKVLDIQPVDANRYYSICLKDACNGKFSDNSSEGVKLKVRLAWLKRREMEAVRDHRDLTTERIRLARREHAIGRKPKAPEEQTVNDRIKMALWLIKRCGTAELAQDALDRAKKALEDKP